MRTIVFHDVVRLGLLAALVSTMAACEVSQEQEVALGDQTAQEVSAQLPIVEDPYIAGYIAELGDTIAKLTRRNDLQWHFYVVNSHQVNAFALPGGYIYINRGLIEATDQMYELAGVLGHEIGHIIQRHSVKQMQNQQKIGVVATLACTLTSFCDNGLGQAAINIGGSAVVARHSRQDEFQADSEAVVNVLRAKIDPAGIPVFFETLMQERRTQPTAVEGWFASHPLEESRVRNSRQLIEATGADQMRGLVRDIQSYREFKRRVASLPEPPRPRRAPGPVDQPR
ncbi:MAG: M48 family metallopeptidase [Gemmatimonadaceae bacterium]